MKKHLSSHIEYLQSRIAPAGLVTANLDAQTATLTIAGPDNLDHAFNLLQIAPGIIRVEGEDGTEIGALETAFLDFQKVKNIIINGGSGIDTITLSNLSLPGSLTINAAGGLDRITATNLSTKGNVSLDLGVGGGTATLDGVTATIGGNFSITYADNGGTVAVTAKTSTIKGSITATGGLGSDILTIAGGKSTILKGISMIGGSGADQMQLTSVGGITIGKGTTGRSVEFDGGLNNDRLTISGAFATLKGALHFAAGDATDDFIISSNALTISGDLTMLGDTGTDTAQLSFLTGTIKGIALFDMGEGTNSVTFTGQTATFGNALNVKGGLSNDTLTLGGSAISIKGAINIEHGAGTNTVTLSAASFTAKNTLSFTGLGGTDTFNFSSSAASVKKALTIHTGDGTGTINLTGIEHGYGSLDILGGINADTMLVTLTSFALAGELKFDSAAGADIFDLQAFQIAIKGKASILTGAGADTAAIVGEGAIKGDLNIDLADATDGTQIITIQGASGLSGGLKIGGALAVNSDSTDANPAVNGYLDSLTANHLKVAKAAAINMGDLDSAIYLDNFSVGAALDVNTGGGNDSLDYEIGNLFGSSTVAKLATIILGDGDDSLFIGVSSDRSSSDFVRFKKGITADGGAGTDISNDFLDALVNVIAGPKSAIGFEPV